MTVLSLWIGNTSILFVFQISAMGAQNATLHDYYHYGDGDYSHSWAKFQQSNFYYTLNHRLDKSWDYFFVMEVGITHKFTQCMPMQDLFYSRQVWSRRLWRADIGRYDLWSDVT